MNLLVASTGWRDMPQVIDVVQTAVGLGWPVKFWGNPADPPPESSTAYDCTLVVGEFKTIHNPGGRRIFWGWQPEGARHVESFCDASGNLDVLRPDVYRALGLPLPVGPSIRSARSSTAAAAPPTPKTLPPVPKSALDVLAGLPPCRFVGFLQDVVGYGEAGRHQLWALHSAGLDVRPASIAEGSSGSVADSELGQMVEAMLQRPGRGRVKPELHVYHLPPDVATAQRCGAGRHVCAVVWETTRIPHEWVTILNRDFHQTWVPTEWQRGVFEACGVRNVEVVPFWLDPRWYPAQGASLDLPGGPRRSGETIFYSVFQWSARKAPEQLLAAYLASFTAKDSVRLVLKTYGLGANIDDAALIRDRVERVQQQMLVEHGQKSARIDLVVDHLSRGDMLALHRACDVFVSLHRGEGWGLPIHEALLLGNPAIFTSIGAPAELWTTPADKAAQVCHRVPASLTPVRGINHHWFRSNQQWGEPDVAAAMRMMQDLHRRRPSPKACRAVGQGVGLVTVAEAALQAFKRVLERPEVIRHGS